MFKLIKANEFEFSIPVYYTTSKRFKLKEFIEFASEWYYNNSEALNREEVSPSEYSTPDNARYWKRIQEDFLNVYTNVEAALLVKALAAQIDNVSIVSTHINILNSNEIHIPCILSDKDHDIALTQYPRSAIPFINYILENPEWIDEPSMAYFLPPMMTRALGTIEHSIDVLSLELKAQPQFMFIS